MKASIIIPALNEEKLLPLLINSIAKQSFRDYEIIVADAGSTDGTMEIAGRHGALVVKGGLPAAGRNAGAAHASGEYLFFFDADVQLPNGFLERAVSEMDERYLDLATCEIRPISRYVLDQVVHRFINISVRASLRIDPKAMGFCIFVTRRLFRRVGGFDETIRVGEDSEFVKRAARIRPLSWLSSVYIDVSVRRFEKEGRLAHIKKGIKLALHRAFKGEVRSHIIEYQFAQYDNEPDEYRTWLVNKIEQALLKLEKPAFDGNREPRSQERDILTELTEDLKRLFKRRGGEQK
jgi:glycosyltransferase involved in cell wall biosynthesis